MRDIPNEVITALESGVFRMAFLVRLEFDTPIRFSSLYETRTFDGVTYVGGGNLGSISSFSEGTDLEPQQYSVTLSGINDATLQAIGGSNYLNRDARCYVVMLDEDGNALGDPMTYFVGFTDEVKFTYAKTASIKVTVRDRLADWNRVKIERNVNADQQAKYPGDKGFEFVSQVADKKIIWPQSEYFE